LTRLSEISNKVRANLPLVIETNHNNDITRKSSIDFSNYFFRST